jgi:hypothetical protein
MKLVSVALAALMAAGAEAQHGQRPVFSSQYEAKLTMSLPYADIVEPIHAWFDEGSSKQRMDYWDGQDVYVFRGDQQATYQIVPLMSQQTCYETKGSVELQSVFPDLSQFVLQPSPVNIGGVVCDDWMYSFSQGGKDNTYHFYASRDTGAPVRYVMDGYNTLFGSHIDEYVVDYLQYTPGPVDQSVFDVASQFTCGPFPGPGDASGRGRGRRRREFRNPLSDVADMFPKGAGSTERAFRSFARAHSKLYASPALEARRLAAFSANMRFVNAQNRRNLPYSLALNHMADWSPEDVKKLRNAKVTAMRSLLDGPVMHEAGTKGAIPDQIDWRQLGAVTPVKDQGICGSCWSFGTAGTMEGTHFLKTGQLVRLSEQALVDCTWDEGNNGCDGGEDFRAFRWLLKNGGKVASDKAYGPYRMADGYCNYWNATATAPGAQITNYGLVQPENVSALLDAIAVRGPISISIDASQRSFTFYSSGVYVEPACKSGEADLDHTVLAVGYGAVNDQGYVIVKNSWSTHWGDQGYVYMSTDKNQCGIASAPAFATM